jgi:hypothetical protein
MNPKIIVIGEENKTISEKKPIEILSSWSAPVFKYKPVCE